jgi:hypothetical protein
MLRDNHYDLDVAYDYELIHFYAQHDYYINGAGDDNDDGGSCDGVRAG